MRINLSPGHVPIFKLFEQLLY
uniref:Uncharacterized protein n=1 Tax=Rhizophora mucronata TaxID=61149 RepID=A0A2P2QQK0_RHIMU